MSHEQQQNLETTSDQNPVTKSDEAVVNTTNSQPADKISQTQPNQSLTDKKATYTEKTTRLQAWSEFLKSVAPFIWVAVILIVIVPLIGRGFIAGSMSGDSRDASDRVNDVVVIDRPIIDQSKIEQAIATAITNAHTKAESFASEQLDVWVDKLMTRVDGSFLDWYFDYFNQKKIEFSTPFVWLSSAAVHWIDTNNPPPSQVVAEKLTNEFQTEFANRVL